MGEHAAVYGRPALLAAIDRRVFVTISTSRRGLSIETPTGAGYIRHAVRQWQRSAKIKTLPPLRIRIVTELDPGYHLGSSAAVAAALVGALTQFFNYPFNKKNIAEIAHEIEKKVHGTPSGADTATATYGGIIWFQKNATTKKIVSLPLKISKKCATWYLVNTGKPRETTGEMVAYVKHAWRHKPAEFKKLLAANERATRSVRTAFENNDTAALKKSVSLGEWSLEGLGVVSGQALSLISTVEHAGGAAKILGGGGRRGATGYVLVFHSDRNKLVRSLTPGAYTVEPIRLGAEGVRIEHV